MLPRNTLPRYVKYFFILGNLVLSCFVIIVLRPIITPLLLAFLFAFLLAPFSAWLEKKAHIPRLLSAFLAILLVLLLIIFLFTFFYMQIHSIQAQVPYSEFADNKILTNFQLWLASLFGNTSKEISGYFQTTMDNIISGSMPFFQGLVSTTAGIFNTIILFLIALFFFLYYRTFFTSFIFKLFNNEKHDQIKEVVSKIDQTFKKYTFGLLLVILIVAILNSFGLYLIGIEYAILFGSLAAVLTIIPYIGILMGSIIPVIFALLTKDSLWYPMGVIIIFSGVQFLEGNFITPNLIGDRVNINPFIALLGLFAGGMLLGVIGMIMAIPMLGLFKIICEEVPSLKPICFVIGQPREGLNVTDKIKTFLKKFY